MIMMVDEKKGDEKLKELALSVNKLSQSVIALGNDGRNHVQLTGSVVLSSSNISQVLNPNYWYALTFYLKGTVSLDIPVSLTTVVEQTAQQIATYNVNNTVPGYKILGVKLQKISIDATNLSTGKVYVAFIGYDKPLEPDIEIIPV